MKYYIAQVLTGEEEKYIKLFCGMHKHTEVLFHFPKKKVTERKLGSIVTRELPLFKGYIILEIDNAADIKATAKQFIKTAGFVRFLKTNTNITELSNMDKKIIENIILEKVIDVQKVYFDINDRIVITEGVMKGLQGNIISVNKQKQRLKIALCDKTLVLNLSYEVVKKI